MFIDFIKDIIKYIPTEARLGVAPSSIIVSVCYCSEMRSSYAESTNKKGKEKGRLLSIVSRMLSIFTDVP